MNRIDMIKYQYISSDSEIQKFRKHLKADHIEILAMDFEADMFFLAEGPSLLLPGVAESLRSTPEEEPLQKVIDQGRDVGVKFLCCSVSAKVIWKMQDDQLPEGMEFAGAATLLEAATDPETVILYF